MALSFGDFGGHSARWKIDVVKTGNRRPMAGLFVNLLEDCKFPVGPKSVN